MLSKDFMSNKGNESNIKSFFVNLDNKYSFTRMYFLLNSEVYVEMVTLAMESNRVDGKKIITESEVLESDSRELSTEDLSKSFLELLTKEDTIKEEYKLNKEQVELILNNYKDNLFGVSKSILDSIN